MTADPEDGIERTVEPAQPTERPARPVYTVPRNATLIGATAMTGLIGRIPREGEVVDPFPFKLLVGSSNLAANGLTVPGLSGMVFVVFESTRGHV